MTSPNTIDVQREDAPGAGRYVATVAGRAGQAELTWNEIAPGIIVADHTYAPETLRGTGAAGAMVQRLIADARASGLKILPACSYVRAQFDRHPEWAGLRADA